MFAFVGRVLGMVDQLEKTSPEIWISQHAGRVRFMAWQVNRISSAFLVIHS